MAEVINTLKQFLEDSEYKYSFDEEANMFHLGFNVDNGSVSVYIEANDDDEFMEIDVLWDGRIPVRSINRVLPLLNASNQRSRYTTLYIDAEKGSIFCRVSVFVPESELSMRQIGMALHLAISTLDENIEAIMREAWAAPSNSDGKYN